MALVSWEMSASKATQSALVNPRLGLAVLPLRGNAVYFEYCNEAGQVDPLSLHAGAPVLSGEKWVATKWMRQLRFVSAS
jgi:prolyl 4-hydroxylase